MGNQNESVRLAKTLLQVKRKDIFFIFTKNFIEQHIQFCSTIFCHFSGNFVIPSSQSFLSFWAKNCSRCLYSLLRNGNFFHWESFVKTEIMEIWSFNVWWIWQMGQNLLTKLHSICLVIPEARGLVLSSWKITFSFYLIWMLFMSAAFSWSNWAQYLLEWIIWFSGRSS